MDRVGATYFFLLSDAYRELREAKVRWESYASSRYHFDDGLRFILDQSGERYPVDHPIWQAYGEKLTEISARVIRAEERVRERTAMVKGVREGLTRFAREHRLSADRITGGGRFPDLRLEEIDTSDVEADPVVAEETYQTLRREWAAEASREKAG
jgi:hypothetical protein